jgi:LysR family hydrogen peroxide-inducible transcriptional activator
MELAQLRYFLKIVEHKNFTRAAKASHVSQPALSQQMAKLEKEFGLPLFERTGRKIRLTETGRTLRTYAEQILQLVEDTHRQIKDNGKSGRVIVSTIPTVGPFLTTKLVHNLSRQFPEAQIQLIEESLESLAPRCVSGEVDFAITTIPKSFKKRLVSEPILQEEIMAVLPVNHRLAKKHSLTACDLKDEPLVLMGKKQCLTQNVEDFLNESDLSIENVVARVEQFSTLQHLVAMGTGISFVPKMAVNPKFKSSLSYTPIAGYDFKRTIQICWSEKRFQSQLASNMIKAIRELADPNLINQNPTNDASRKKSGRPESNPELNNLD